jgi:hypothetical protein
MLPARRPMHQIGERPGHQRGVRSTRPGPLPYRRASWSGACEYSSSSEQGRQMPCDTRRWGDSAPRPRPSGRPHQAQTTVRGAGSGDSFSRVARGAGMSVRELRLEGIRELQMFSLCMRKAAIHCAHCQVSSMKSGTGHVVACSTAPFRAVTGTGCLSRAPGRPTIAQIASRRLPSVWKRSTLRQFLQW